MTTPDITVNLTRYSLNHVVAYDKTLWQPPLKWTSAHLSVLGIHPRRRRLRQPLCRDIHPTTTNGGVLSEEDGDSSDTDHERNHEGGGERGEGGKGDDQFYDAVIPNLTSARLGQFIASFSGGGLYETRACQLIRLLLGTPPRPIARRDTNKDHERRDDSVPGRRFSFRWFTPELIVGPRTYKLHFLFHLILGATLVLPYVDSSCVLRPRFRVRRRRDLTRPFEPFIAAVLISLAQSSVPLEKADAEKGQSNSKASASQLSPDKTAESATDGVITTRLLFTHRDDSEDMHVYTAYISHPLLERFQSPNQPPTATTQPLIQLDHSRVPYVPHATFRQRLLAAVSVTAVVKPNLEMGPRCEKRTSPPHDETVSSKRPRLENLREPLSA
ncbi:hypothetical protein F5Y08DRAFT_302441 [Xylaria arbuscula]|nr:hypothetical protein F5Y08DRAFT_302441 [Xylaria arbuscula]